ncbi:MAG: PAS domain S-box protein [Methylococcales bacterium]|nr:PAS domain S-box protein [Methylococcales bacterium]
MPESKKELPLDMLAPLNEAALISTTDLKGIITFVNDEFCRHVGYSEKELVGKNHSILNSHIHSDDFFKNLWETISKGKNWSGEICNRHKNGQLHWLNMSIFPILDKDNGGKVQNYISISFDVTEKKRLEIELQSQKMQYDSVIESTDGFWELNKDGRFVDVSECYCQLSGYSEQELLGMMISDLEASDHKGDLMYQLSTLNNTVTSKVFESMHQRKDGTQWFVEVLMSFNPKHDNFYIFLRDISKRKLSEHEQAALQQQLNHLQKLESIGRLTAGIAHDFNNILASILGYNELNKYVAEELPDGEAKEDLIHNSQQVEIAGSRAADLIKKMLTYCRQDESNKSEATLELTEVLNKILVMLQEVIPSTIVIEYDLLENTYITIDETDLYQIIVNLIVNARDAMPANKGTIKLGVYVGGNYSTQVCSACQERIIGKFVEIKISDTGSGISPAKLSRIFEPFFTTKEVGEGTGLGLSVVSGIIHKMGGHIIVASEIGVGTTFKLLFP